ncbi:hypothetical protein Tco_1256419 [Tanacetum coccineum]
MTATPPPPLPSTVAPPPTQQGLYHHQTARIKSALTTYHIGEPSSADPYVTATRASKRYFWQDPTGQPIRSYKPRPPMVRSPHVLPGTPVGFASGLNQFEQNMIRELTEAANTARYRLDLQADTMSGMLGTINRMDAQMMWMLRDH